MYLVMKMAPVRGFEPRLPGLTDRRSRQVSKTGIYLYQHVRSINIYMMNILQLALVFSTAIHPIDYVPTRAPAVCNLTREVFEEMREERARIVALTRMAKDGVEQTILVWHTASDELVVTITQKNTDITCIVAMGDKDTIVFPPPNTISN
jgi:K+ transporter